MSKAVIKYFRNENLKDLSLLTLRNYSIKASSFLKINKGAYKIKSDGEEYFAKHCNVHSLNKYNFLSEIGVDNVMYPIKNSRNEFVSKLDDDFENAYYVLPFVKNHYVIDEVKAVDLIK